MTTASARGISGGAAVALLCEMAGFPPDDAQRAVLDQVFARKPDGTVTEPHCRLPPASRDDLTRTLTCCVLGWMYLADEPRILWTTRSPRTADDSFRQLMDVIERSGELARLVTRVSRANGAQEVTLGHGPRLLMRTRRSGARGMSVSRLIIDEAEGFTSHDAVNLFPVLNPVGGQVLYGAAG